LGLFNMPWVIGGVMILVSIKYFWKNRTR
jgi:hypothetical protein